MSETRNFWQLLHTLADELQDEGDSDYERALSLAAWLEQMPAGDRAACLADLEAVASVLAELANGYPDAASSNQSGKVSPPVSRSKTDGYAPRTAKNLAIFIEKMGSSG